MRRPAPVLMLALAACGAREDAHPQQTKTLHLDEGPVNAASPGEMSWNYEYDAQGNLTRSIDPNGGETSYIYDSLERPRVITLPAPSRDEAGPIIQTDHDALGRETRVLDPRRLATEYSTDGLGQTTRTSSPDSGIGTSTFDEAGNLSMYTDARGRTNRYTYDSLDRLVRIDHASGPPCVYEYDGGATGAANGIGRLTRMTDESGSTSYGYDGFGRLIRKTQVVGEGDDARTFAVAYAWGETGTATGKLTALTYPSGMGVEISYDFAGRPSAVVVHPASTSSGAGIPLLKNIRYTATQRLAGWTWGDGTTYERTYDSFDRLASYFLGNPSGNGPAAGFVRHLRYDAAGLIAAYTHTDGNGTRLPELDQTFDHDGLGRLILAVRGGVAREYAYDATGNRTALRVGDEIYTNVVDPTSNRLVSVQRPSAGDPRDAVTHQYGYDAGGNLISDGTNAFVYSDRGRMSQAVTPNGTLEYLVNAREQRVRKRGPANLVPTGVVHYVYDEQGHLLGEYDAEGTPFHETIYLADTPIGLLEPGSGDSGSANALHYVYADQVYAPRIVVRGEDHSVVWRWDEVEPFGDSPPDENPTGLGSYVFNQRFPGQVHDAETGLFYNGHRDYSPAAGQYVQSDPIGLRGGINPYAYAAGDPLANWDPRGLDCRRTGRGTLFCSYPGGTEFSVPAPRGPERFADSILEHQYHLSVPLGDASADCVIWHLTMSPTPGSPEPATPHGTRNNAVVIPGVDNWVTSYVTTDVNTRQPVIVNLTDARSQFAPGYVARTVHGGQVHTYGEGANWKQSPLVSGQRLQDFGNDLVWRRQMEEIVEKCACERRQYYERYR